MTSRDRGLQPERTSLAWLRTALALMVTALLTFRQGLLVESQSILLFSLSTIVFCSYIVVQMIRHHKTKQFSAYQFGLLRVEARNISLLVVCISFLIAFIPLPG